MGIKVVLAKAHEIQLSDPELRKEFDSVSGLYADAKLSYTDGTINFVFVKGVYSQAERKMVTVCLLVNKMKQSIHELHGVLRLKFANKSAAIAKTTIDFDKAFLGCLNPDEALLVHLGIPVKGLQEDAEFTIRDILGEFTDVRVTFTEGEAE